VCVSIVSAVFIQAQPARKNILMSLLVADRIGIQGSCKYDVFGNDQNNQKYLQVTMGTNAVQLKLVFLLQAVQLTS
jgi:hypothetical protein